MYYTAVSDSPIEASSPYSLIDMKKVEQRKLFLIFLVSSLFLHLGALLYQNKEAIHLSAAPISDAPISMRINIRKPVVIPKVQPVKKVVKKDPFKKREIEKEVIKEAPKKVVEQPIPVTPQTTTKSFDSVIANYSQPRYPRMAIRRGLTGIVTLTLWIRGNGNVDKVELTKSSGHKSLDQSALDAVKSWKFKNIASTMGHIFKVEKRIVYRIN